DERRPRPGPRAAAHTGSRGSAYGTQREDPPGQRGRPLRPDVRRHCRPPHPAHYGRGILDGLVGGGVLRGTDGRLPVRHPLRPPRHRQIDQLRARGRALFAARPGRGRRRSARRLRPRERPSDGYVGGRVDRPARCAGPSRSGRVADPGLDEPHRRARRSGPTRDVRGTTSLLRRRGPRAGLVGSGRRDRLHGRRRAPVRGLSSLRRGGRTRDSGPRLRSHGQPRLRHCQSRGHRHGKALEGATRGGERPRARHTRHRGSHVPLRQRGRAGEGGTRRPAARAGAGGSRGAPSGSVGRRRARDIAAHGVRSL
ncbi:MAG: hypothetical protein AVDCRST_MAG01-01-3482, partial [uncultured Rubrobacteraceae bacterium]